MTGDRFEHAAGSAVSAVGSGWRVAAGLMAATSRLGVFVCLAFMVFGVFLSPLWSDRSGDLPNLLPLLLSTPAAIGLIGAGFIGNATCKLMDKELQVLKEQILGTLPSIHSLPCSPHSASQQLDPRPGSP